MMSNIDNNIGTFTRPPSPPQFERASEALGKGFRTFPPAVSPKHSVGTHQSYSPPRRGCADDNEDEDNKDEDNEDEDDDESEPRRTPPSHNDDNDYDDDEDDDDKDDDDNDDDDDDDDEDSDEDKDDDCEDELRRTPPPLAQ